jgi:hypothetical protein
VTLIANYQPLQDAYGGPNYFAMDPNALYEIHVDNNGDAKRGHHLPVPLQQHAGRRPGHRAADRQSERGHSAGAGGCRGQPGRRHAEPGRELQRQHRARRPPWRPGAGGDKRQRRWHQLRQAGGQHRRQDAAYAGQHIYSVNIPGCSLPAKLFVGQRQEAFAVNLGVIFDLVNAPAAVITNPALFGAATNQIGDKNVTTLALEVHRDCLKSGAGGDDVIGGWTTASLRQARLLNPNPPSGHQTFEKPGGAWVQVSRLGMPLVNEVVIGLKDKDRFNASAPQGDGQFATYVTHPTLPRLLEIALGLPGIAPNQLSAQRPGHHLSHRRGRC